MGEYGQGGADSGWTPCRSEGVTILGKYSRGKIAEGVGAKLVGLPPELTSLETAVGLVRGTS